MFDYTDERYLTCKEESPYMSSVEDILYIRSKSGILFKGLKKSLVFFERPYYGVWFICSHDFSSKYLI